MKAINLLIIGLLTTTFSAVMLRSAPEGLFFQLFLVSFIIGSGITFASCLPYLSEPKQKKEVKKESV